MLYPTTDQREAEFSRAITHFEYDFAYNIEPILRAEGGFAADAGLTRDSGGLTKYGISQKAYPARDIENLTMRDALEIYYTDYYTKLDCTELPYPVDLLMLDSAVNMGVSAAVKQLQRCVGANVDGIMGEQTLQMTNAMSTAQLFSKLLVARAQYYANIVAQKRCRRVYLTSWFNRLQYITDYAMQEM